jgi:propanol-preferring alcohol dehydrogenase
VPRPEPGPGDVLVKVEACGVGLTVVNICSGKLQGPTGVARNRIPGHEIAGVVAETGAGVTRFKPGDRVLAYFYITCGYCRYCRRGKEPLCENFGGYVGNDVNGGYAEYVSLPEGSWFTLPDSLDFVAATTIPDAIGTPVHVCGSRANLRPGDRALIVGAAGGVGVHMVQVARLHGAEVIAVDLDDAKLERVKQYGADHVVNIEGLGAEAAREKVMAITGGYGPDAVIDTVGSRETLRWGFEVLGKAGVLVSIATHPGVEMSVAPGTLVFKEVSVVGSRYHSKAEYERAIELVRVGRITPVISEIGPLEAVEEMHRKLRAATFFGRGAVVPSAQPARTEPAS